MEQNPLDVSTSQRVVQIKNRRKKQGNLQYQVIFNNNEKGKWVNFEDLDTKDRDIINMIEIYDKAHPFRKVKQIASNKKIKEIVGMMNDFQEPKYVVKFEGSETLESVHSSYLKRYYKTLLLDFFESKIQFDFSKTTISDPLNNSQTEEIEESSQNSVKDEANKIEDNQQTANQISISNSSPSRQSHQSRQQTSGPMIQQSEYTYNTLYPPQMIVQLNQSSNFMNPQNFYYQQQVPYMMQSTPNMMTNASQYMAYPPLNYPQKPQS